MKTTTLGVKSPLEVRSIGLGCWGMVDAYQPVPNRENMVRFTREAVERGATFFDTAEVYGPYISKEIIGEALQGIRERVVIATKFGFDIQNGKSVGLDSRPVTIRKAHAILPLTAVQNEYSLWMRDAEKDYIPVLEELGIGLVCSSPLGRGYLTGKIPYDTRFGKDDVRAGMPRFENPSALEANRKIVDFARYYAQKKGCTPAQFALAWIRSQKPWIVPIPGTTKVGRLEENLKADAVTFTSEEIRQMNQELDQIQIIGARYNAQQECLLEK